MMTGADRKLLALGVKSAEFTARELSKILDYLQKAIKNGLSPTEQKSYGDFQQPGGVSLLNVTPEQKDVQDFTDFNAIYHHIRDWIAITGIAQNHITGSDEATISLEHFIYIADRFFGEEIVQSAILVEREEIHPSVEDVNWQDGTVRFNYRHDMLNTSHYNL